MTNDHLIEAVRKSAFSSTTMGVENLIHLFEAGSALHGARLTEKSDLDIAGIFIEPKVNIFGMSPFEHLVTSTSDEAQRNTADDTDITLYSLRRWAYLACKGNPTALSFLFAPNAQTVLWDCEDVSLWGMYASTLREAIVAKSAAGHFTGFVSGQMKRLLGEKGQGKHGQRPELEAAFGYDTKAAMHAVRLCGEGIELMETGIITYPRHNVDQLLRIRRGEWSLDKVNSVVSALLQKLEEAREKSALREKPNYIAVNEILVSMYEEFYDYD